MKKVKIFICMVLTFTMLLTVACASYGSPSFEDYLNCLGKEPSELSSINRNFSKAEKDDDSWVIVYEKTDKLFDNVYLGDDFKVEVTFEVDDDGKIDLVEFAVRNEYSTSIAPNTACDNLVDELKTALPDDYEYSYNSFNGDNFYNGEYRINCFTSSKWYDEFSSFLADYPIYLDISIPSNDNWK